jgi:hypothetical protein
VYAGRPAFVANAVTLRSSLVSTSIEDLMPALDAHYGFPTGERTGRVLIFSAWPTPDLSQYGWTLLGEVPLMLRQAGGDIPESRSGLRVVAVRDEMALRHAEMVTVRGFGIRDQEVMVPGGLFGTALLEDDRMRMWVGYAGDTPVTTSACFVSAGITNVINVATLPEARGRGYGSEVTWHATLTDPSLPSLLIASAQGRPVYERMGFSTIRQFRLLSRTSPTE